jgi:hypothetical protein
MQDGLPLFRSWVVQILVANATACADEIGFGVLRHRLSDVPDATVRSRICWLAEQVQNGPG